MDGGRFLVKADQQIELDLPRFVPDPRAIDSLSEKVARECRAVPISFACRAKMLCLATELAHDKLIMQQLRSSVDELLDVQVISMGESQFEALINRCYSHKLSFDAIVSELACDDSFDPSANAIHPLIRLLDNILHEAVCHRASDIHIGWLSASQCRIRFRVDGVLSTWRELPSHHLAAIVVRIKLLASMDIAESRFAQDGQLSMQVQGSEVDFRVSSFPTLFGENIVLRVLNKALMLQTLPVLLADSPQLEQIGTFHGSRDGLTIVCGPTGCGKSTTLLSMLAELDSESLNIMTLEDPVENVVGGIQQCTVRADIDFDFAEATRALLRQDPDILFIGEIRDQQSAAMAFRAALTGHGVFTTVHCRDTESAISRLLDLGVGYSGIASCVNLILAQRLIRKLCTRCSILKKKGEKISCEHCNGSGYCGRIAVVELMPISESIRALLCSESAPADIRKQAGREGMQSLSQQIDLVIERGLTDQAEKIRVLGES